MAFNSAYVHKLETVAILQTSPFPYPLHLHYERCFHIGQGERGTNAQAPRGRSLTVGEPREVAKQQPK